MKIPAWTLLVLPTLVFALGFTCNEVAVAANGGAMPALIYGCTQDLINETPPIIHTCFHAGVHLKFLCDWILLRGDGYYSPGDFGIMFGTHTFYPGIIAWFASRLTRDGLIR
jgi:hypothetical protein